MKTLRFPLKMMILGISLFPLYSTAEIAQTSPKSLLVVKAEENSLAESFDEPESTFLEFEDMPNFPEDGTKASKDIQNFTLQHRINKKTVLPKKTIEGALMVLLQAFKDDVMVTSLEYPSQSLHIDTLIDLVLSEEMNQEVGHKIPSLSVKTDIDNKGQGHSVFTLPPFQHRKQNQEILGWKGLEGQLKFTHQFDQLTALVNLAHFIFNFKAERMALEKMVLETVFDIDLIPTQIKLNLPYLSHRNEERQIDLQNFLLNLKVDKAEQGVEISQGQIKIGELVIDDGMIQSTFKQLELSGQGQIEKNLIRYGIHTQVDQWLSTSDDLEIRYQGDLEFRRIDAQSLAKWQTSLRDLQRQRQQGAISEEIMMIGRLLQFHEIAPKLMAQSPEIAITRFYLKDKQSVIQGHATLGIEGKKFTSLDNIEALLPALKVQIELNLGQALLEKLILNQFIEQQKLAEITIKNRKLTEKETAQLQTQAKIKTTQQIKKYVEQNWLVHVDAHHYQFIAQLVAGQLLVNGKEKALPLPVISFLETVMTLNTSDETEEDYEEEGERTEYEEAEEYEEEYEETEYEESIIE